jgi:hypothetical protein
MPGIDHLGLRIATGECKVGNVVGLRWQPRRVFSRDMEIDECP